MTETAILSKMDCIITRNKKDYTKAGIPIYDPIEFWNVQSGTQKAAPADTFIL